MEGEEFLVQLAQMLKVSKLILQRIKDKLRHTRNTGLLGECAERNAQVDYKSWKLAQQTRERWKCVESASRTERALKPVRAGNRRQMREWRPCQGPHTCWRW